MKTRLLLVIICMLITTISILAEGTMELLNNGAQEFPYIWISNTGEGTLSKLDIRTGAELAKYYTGAEANTEPGYIAVDIDGNCWVINHNTGTVLKILTNEYIDRNNNNSIETCIDINENGKIEDDEILAWGEDEAVIEIRDYIENEPETIVIDKENRVWIGVSNPAGYLILDNEGTLISELGISGIPQITCAASNGFIWSYSRGLNLLEKINMDEMTYAANYPMEEVLKEFVLDKNGQAWGITDNNQVFRFDIEEEEITNYPLPDRDYRGIIADNENNIWLVSADRKLIMLNSKGEIRYRKDIKIADIEPEGLVLDNKNIWTINSSADSISRFDKEGNFLATYTTGNNPGTKGDLNGYKLWNTGLETSKIAIEQGLDKEEFYAGDFSVSAEMDLKGLGTPFSRKNPIDLIMIIDVSGSMSGSPINNVKTASREIIKLLQNDDRGAVVTFASGSSVRQGFTNNKDSLVKAINGLSGSGGTNIARGIQSSISHFSSNEREEAQKVAILLSDGGSSVSPALQQAGIAKENEILIFTLGIGNGVNQALLQEISDITDATYHYSPTPEQISQMMDEIGGQIFNTSGRDVLLQITIPVLAEGLTLDSLEPEADRTIVHDDGSKTVEYNYQSIQMKEEKSIKLDYTGEGVYPDKHYLSESTVLTYINTDGEEHEERLEGLSIVLKEKPGFIPTGNKATYEGMELEFELSVKNFENDSISFSADGLPAGAVLNPETGVFAWIPEYNDEGDYDIRFTAEDDTYTDSMDLKITVFNMNRAPVIGYIGPKEVIEEETIEFKIFAEDPDGDELVFSAGNLPEGAIFDSMTQTFSWTPALKQAGFYPDIAFYVIDGNSGNDRLMGVEKMDIRVLISDNIPPVSTVSLKGDKWSDDWFKTDVEVSLSAVDNPGGTGVETIYYQTAGTGDYHEYTDPFMIRGDGVHELYVYAVDRRGNQEIPHRTEIKISKPWEKAPYTALVQGLKSYGEIRIDDVFSNGNVLLAGNCAFNYLGTKQSSITKYGEIKIKDLELSAPYRELPIPDWEALKEITTLRYERQLLNNRDLSNIRYKNDLSIVGNTRLSGILVVDGNLEIHGQTVLNGVGIFCTGKVTITGNTKMNGFIYSGSDITIYGQPDFAGAMVVNGEALVAGNIKNSSIDLQEYLQWLKRVDLQY